MKTRNTGVTYEYKGKLYDTQVEVAEAAGVVPTTVSKHLGRYGHLNKLGVRKYCVSPSAPLSPPEHIQGVCINKPKAVRIERMLWIIDARKKGYSILSIGKALGLASSSVTRVIDVYYKTGGLLQK